MMTTIKKSNCDKTQFRTQLLKKLFVITTGHLDNQLDVLRAAL